MSWQFAVAYANGDFKLYDGKESEDGFTACVDATSNGAKCKVAGLYREKKMLILHDGPMRCPKNSGCQKKKCRCAHVHFTVDKTYFDKIKAKDDISKVGHYEGQLKDMAKS